MMRRTEAAIFEVVSIFDFACLPHVDFRHRSPPAGAKIVLRKGVPASKSVLSGNVV